LNFEQAICATSTDIVVLSDQDDIWHPEQVEHALRALNGDPLPHFSDARLVDVSGEQVLADCSAGFKLPPMT
jgi:hypothetical protein